jgi:hypothetical protein
MAKATPAKAALRPQPVPESARAHGNASIFKPKNGDRFQGVTTKLGTTRFEAARGRLAKLAGREKEHVSDGDVFEYLARGESETRAYLKEMEAAER